MYFSVESGDFHPGSPLRAASLLSPLPPARPNAMTLKLLSRQQPARAVRGEGRVARGGRKCYTDVTVRYTCTGGPVQVLLEPWAASSPYCMRLPRTPSCLPDAAEVFSASGHQRASARRGEAAASATTVTAAATLVIARPRSDSTSKPRYADQTLGVLMPHPHPLWSPERCG